MSIDQKKICMYCKFWNCRDMSAPEELMDSISGECRISAPRLVGTSNEYWPVTRGGSWCGEFVDVSDEHIRELPSTWEHISEPVGRVIEKSANAYLNGNEDVA